jgi:dCTP deaminase
VILSAQTIRKMCGPRVRPLVFPFCERSVYAATGTSYGLSSCGYDVRVDAGMQYVDHYLGTPLSVTEVTLPPRAMTLLATIEEFDLPRGLCMRVLDKSTLVRQGITVQNTIAEPGWRGHLTLEVVNHTRSYIVIPVGAPIAQVVFETLDEPTLQPYGGKYQAQERGPQLARKELA